MPSRFRLASQAAIRCCRDSPASLGPSPIFIRALVVTSTELRLPSSACAEDLLRHAPGIDVGGVEQVDAGLDAAVDQPLRPGEVGLAGLGEHPLAAEGHGAEGQDGDTQAGTAELAVVHGVSGCWRCWEVK